MLRRLSFTPFETVIAAFLIISGITTLGHVGRIDPFDALLPSWEILAVAALSITSGALMITGVGVPWHRAEAAGLIGLWAVITVRFVLYGYLLGFDATFAVQAVFDTAVALACIARLRTIRRGAVLVLLNERKTDHAVRPRRRRQGDPPAGH